MRYILAIFALTFSSLSFANTYNNCQVDNVFTHDTMPNLVTVTLTCNALDAMTTGADCKGTIKPNAFVIDTSSATGKNHMALALTAMAAGNKVYATTWGACSAAASDTLYLYALRVFRL